MASPPAQRWRIRNVAVLLFAVSSCALVGCTPVVAENLDCGKHGRLLDNGLCACDNCWTGDQCDKEVDLNLKFRTTTEVVTLNPLRVMDSPEEPIFTAKAEDPDGKDPCPSAGECPCREIQYSFGAGPDNVFYYIDTSTGQVKVHPDTVSTARYSSLFPEDTEHRLQILAHNPRSHNYKEMTLVVKTQPTVDMRIPGVYLEDSYIPGEQHHVHKRSVITLPSNVTFTLIKTGSSENVTEMRVGTRVSFQLTILFPQTTTDMLVELFAPDNDTIVMMLCSVTIASIGSNLAYDGDAEIVMDSQNSSTKYYDRAIIDFGNVTNNFAAQDAESHSSIVITWDAVMIQNDDTVHQTDYWVSAGAEYNYENEVWVGQASLTALTDAEPSFGLPMLNLSGPSSIEVGSSAVFRLDMYITQPSTALSIDAFAPLNDSDVMTICGMKVVDTGENYECGFLPEEHAATFYLEANTRGNGRARLDLGTVTNKGARDTGNPTANNRISVEFVVHVYDDASYVGQSYWVGAAVEIGTQHIWAGEILVSVVAFNPTAAITPSWTITKAGSGKVSTVAPLLMTLDITIPRYTSGKYALEVLAPFNDSAAVFQLCAISIMAFGENLMCTDNDITPYYTSRGSVIYVDRGYADLGVITNVGPWGWTSNSTDPNVIEPDVLRVQFLMKATNHSLNTVGSVHSVTLGLIINDNRLLVGSYDVEVEADVDLPNITDDTTPDWNVSWDGGDGSIPIGGAGQFLVSVTTKRGTVYSPFDLEALMPNSTGATQVSVCKVVLHSVGANVPCVIAAAVNESVVYTSQLEDGLYDRAVINLPSVCNYEVVNDTAEDVLVFKVGFMLQDGAGLTNGTELWPSVGVMFSPYKMWVGQIQAWARDDLTNSGTPPHVAVVKVSGDVPMGYFASYLVLIKTVPGDVWRYSLNVTVSTAGLSVCSVKVIQVGDGMPCLLASTLLAWYEQDSTGANIRGSIDIGSVSNAGGGAMLADSTVDDNTIVAEVMIGVSPDSALITAGSSYGFDVQVDYDSSAINPSVDSFDVTSDTSSINTTATNVSSTELTMEPITETDNDTDVVLGQSKRVQLCTWTYPGTITRLSTKMMTPVDTPDVMEVTYIGVSFAGRNLPCSSCKGGTVTFETRTGSSHNDIATLDHGYVINNNLDADDIDANKLCVDGVFRVLRSDALTPGSTIALSASLNIDDVEITIIEKTLTVVDNSTFVDIYPENATVSTGAILSVNSTVPDPLCLTPGDVQTFPVVASVPPYITSLSYMDIKLDVNESACMTVQDVRLISTGRNLRGFGKDYDMVCTPNSTFGTTQADMMECSFGILTNPGMSHRCDDFATDDDSLYLEVDVQMADCTIAEADTNLTASFGFKAGSYIAILNYPVTVCRTGSEEPIYNISVTANSTGDEMYMDYEISLDNTSSAEIHNSSFVVMPPPYVACDSSPIVSSGGNMVPTLDTSVSNRNRMVFDMGSVYFTDAIHLVLRCEANTSYTVPSGVSGHYTVVNYHMSGDVIPRAVNSYAQQTVWSDLDFVNVTITTVSDTGVACTSTAVGMNNPSVIYDCQISGSEPYLTNGPTQARQGLSGWTPYVREGELKAQRYLQVYFANKMLIDRVEVFQTATAKATQIKLAYSNDGQAFLDGDTIALAGLSSEMVQVPSPQEAQALRVYVTNEDISGQQVTLAFEFYGCAVSTGGPTGQAAICAAATSAVPAVITDPLFYRRSFVATATGVVYVCDGVVESKGTVQRCFMSPDGDVWRPLDPRVAAIVGHDGDLDRVYALAEDGVTFMSSGDQGLTWASTHTDVVSAAQTQVNYVQAMEVPWTDNTQLTAGDPPSNRQIGVWGASYDFLKKNEGGSWNSKLKWNCC